MQASNSRSLRRWLVGLLILLLVAALAWWLWPAATPAHKEASGMRGGKGMGMIGGHPLTGDARRFAQSGDQRGGQCARTAILLPAAVQQRLRVGGCFAFSVELASDAQDLQLRPSLRYAHSPRYVERLAQAHGFRVRQTWQAPLREDQQQPVMGLYVLLERAA